jgi:uncharacterized protein
MNSQNEQVSPAPLVVRSTDARYTRGSAFSYSCHACSRCCHDKIIHVNPYEVARLAKNRGVSTTEFLAQYTDANGITLKQTDAGACVFLSPQGCSVHADRPLVCRLYPLGRHVTADGEETFVELIPHPQSEGRYSNEGTVQDYLTKQGIGPFIQAVERYVALVGSMAATIYNNTCYNKMLRSNVKETVEPICRHEPAEIPDWFDTDKVLDRFCAEQRITVPEDGTEKMELHIRAIEAWQQHA